MTFNRLLAWGVLVFAFVVIVPQVLSRLIMPENIRVAPIANYYENANEIDALTFGSSHGRSIYYPAMGLNGHSFGEDGGDIALSELKLRAALPTTPNLKVVFLPVSPATLSFDSLNSDTVDSHEFDKWLRNTPLSHEPRLLSLSEWLKLEEATIFSVEKILTLNYFTRKQVGALVRKALGGASEKLDNAHCRLPSKNVNHAHEFGIRFGYFRYAMAAKCLPVSAEHSAYWHERRVKFSTEALPNIKQDNLALLDNMATLLAERGASLILFVPPLTKSYIADPRIQGVWNEERPMLEEFVSRHENVKFFDDSDLFEVSDYDKDNQWFYDDNHLTLEGAKIYSTVLAKEMSVEPMDNLIAVGAAVPNL